MKKFLITNKKTQEICGKFDSKNEAADEMMDFIENHNEDLDSEDEDYLTPFDFSLEEVEIKEVNECITDFEKARKHLNGKPNADFTVSKKILSDNSVKLEDVARLVNDINPKHMKALVALNELFTIAQAWNKEDNFTPDFSNRNQTKWFPWFVYSNANAGFVCARTFNTATIASAHIGSRLCFKTSDRARQFGEQFIDLWNDVLLFRQPSVSL
ncbi:hypothetical protein [Xylanibacter rodentium]|uniref:hypothetical protein n=1 Tax=Xylanibacter rodentium TaxID=2736289 RepID=UPI0025935812|nr:hypothetical protein [Xylanibacter rodentium]